MLGAMMGQASSYFGYMLMFGAPAFLVLSYFFIVWDQRRPDSDNAGDSQVGLKLALFFLALVGLGMAVSGTSAFLHYLLSGTKTGTGTLKVGIASILTGLVVVGGIWFVFLPRTNYNEYPKATRYALGYVAVIAGMVAALSLNGFVVGLFSSAPWAMNSGNFANLIIFGALAGVTLMRFGALSGWIAPPPRQQGFGGGAGAGGFGGQMPPGQQPAGGYPAQQPQGQAQGFPGQQPQGQPGAQGGGFPPGGGQQQPGGGFPPGAPQGGGQGGGFPGPSGGGGQGQGGGGGGFPPSGGGGLPPPSGSGGGGGFPR